MPELMDFHNEDKIAEIRSHLIETEKKLASDVNETNKIMLSFVTSVSNTLEYAVGLQDRGHHQIGHADLVDDEAIAEHLRDGGMDFLHRAHYLIHAIYADIIENKT